MHVEEIQNIIQTEWKIQNKFQLEPMSRLVMKQKQWPEQGDK